MFRAQNKETINSTWKVAVRVLKDYSDDERNKAVFHKPARPRPIFWSETGLVPRPVVSDQIIAFHCACGS